MPVRLRFAAFIVAMFDQGATRFPEFEMVVPEMVKELVVKLVLDRDVKRDERLFPMTRLPVRVRFAV
jgi:hypothetical protein